MTRRDFLKSSAIASFVIIGSSGCKTASWRQGKPVSPEQELVIEGTKAALEKSLLPALLEQAYPGHFTISAEGRTYGKENTWPGLDSWQMAGAYLLVGRHREMLDYFDFVQASQRGDGNIPFAIFPGDKPPEALNTWLRAMKFPEDVYSYRPQVRAGQPGHSNVDSRKWVGLFTHWQTNVNPLSVLGAASYILTAAEIFAALKSEAWLAEKLPSLEAAGHYLVTRVGANGLLGGAGFYLEAPPRHQWDGVTQCYGIFVFHQLAAFNRVLKRREAAAIWARNAASLSARFQETFWQKDHFAEYLHPERGLVDSHGLSDVNWAAIGLGVATRKQTKTLWPILTSAEDFWRGGMPTHVVTNPGSYEPWEFSEALPFEYDKWTHDVAAMGRVWHLEALACRRVGDYRRLRESVVKVCEMGRRDAGFWHERYHAAEGNTVKAAGTYGYCEYPAILVRVVLGNPDIFPEARMLRADLRQVNAVERSQS